MIICIRLIKVYGVIMVSNMVIAKSREDWENEFIVNLKNSKRLNANLSIVLDLYISENKTKLQEKQLRTCLDAEYKKYCFEIDYQNIKASTSEKTFNAIKKIRQEKNRDSEKNRKLRAAELIKIGALTDVTNFPKDKGLIAGAFLYVLQAMSSDPKLESLIKADGDKLLHDREIQKKEKGVS